MILLNFLNLWEKGKINICIIQNDKCIHKSKGKSPALFSYLYFEIIDIEYIHAQHKKDDLIIIKLSNKKYDFINNKIKLSEIKKILNNNSNIKFPDNSDDNLIISKFIFNDLFYII